jgi:DNA-binding NarL/FixJ family response regulator
VQDLLPDIIILDISIPGNGLSAARTISAQFPVVKIIMLTGSADEDDVMAALKAGVEAYVLKGVAARELVGIIHTVQAGESYITPTLAASLLMEMTSTHQGETSPAETTVMDELTERERQILELIAAGKSNREIGQQLFLAEKTVKHYVTNILQKLRVRNRVQAALLAQQKARL